MGDDKGRNMAPCQNQTKHHCRISGAAVCEACCTTKDFIVGSQTITEKISLNTNEKLKEFFWKYDHLNVVADVLYDRVLKDYRKEEQKRIKWGRGFMQQRTAGEIFKGFFEKTDARRLLDLQSSETI